MKLLKLLKIEHLVLVVLIAIGSLIRLQGVINNTFAYTYDVGRDMLALWNIVFNHDLMFIGATTGIEGVFYGPWWYYLLTPFFVVFQGDPRGIAFTMSLIGILCIPFSYYIGEKLTGKTLGLIFALLVSSSPYLVSLSIQIWNPNIAPLFVILTFITLYKIYSSKNIIYYLLLGVFLGLNIDIEILWGVLLTLGIISSLVVVLKSKFNIKRFGLLIFGIVLVASPRIIFEIKHGFLMTKSFINFVFSPNSKEDPITFLQLLSNRFLTFLDLFSSTLTFNNRYVAVFVIVFMICAILKYYRNSSVVLKKIILNLLIVLIVFFVGTVLFKRALWPHYLVGIPLIYIFIFSISLILIPKKYLKLLAIGVVILFIANLNPIDRFRNFIQDNWEGDAALYRNHIAVIDYVYSQANGKDFKYVVYTPPVHDYTYRYLFKWYGPNKYKYSFDDEAKLAFFIIEPDPGYEDRIKWWLNDRKNDGKIIKTQKIQGGVIVQTRDVN